VTALVVGIGFAQIAFWLFESGLRQYLRNTLITEAEGLLVAIVRGPDGLQLDEQRLNPAYDRAFSGRYFIIDIDGQRWRSRSLWDNPLPPPEYAGLQSHLSDGPGDQKVLTFRADYRRLGQTISITVAQDYSPLLEQFNKVRWFGIGLGLVALGALLISQRLAVRRALRPLEQVRQQVAQLQKGRRSELDSTVPEELDALVGQINRLLAHTEDNLKRSRVALGNLGHALKTPLAVLFSLANRREWAQHPALQSTMIEQLRQIEERLARDLGRARLAGEALPKTHFVCDDELPALLDTLRMVHGHNLELHRKSDTDLRLPWDREDMLELIGNLLDNACKWASNRVDLVISRTDGGYDITIDDDGPGIAEEARSQVLARGIRLDEQTAGHGLGLGIVRDIVENVSGKLSLENAPMGGLRVRVRLPAGNEASVSV
jgi:signal transduction histidine kinase